MVLKQTTIKLELLRSTTSTKENQVLMANDRRHYRQTAQWVKRIRQIGHERGVINGTKFLDKPVDIEIIIKSSARRRFDPPNLYPTIKALIDGFVDAGMFPDDNGNIIRSFKFTSSDELCPVKGHYGIEINISEVD